MQTIIHFQKKERMLPDVGVKDEASNLLHTLDSFLGESLTEILMKATEWVGGKIREIELGMKKMRERLMETREHDEKIGNSNQRNQRNQILSKTTSFFRLQSCVL